MAIPLAIAIAWATTPFLALTHSDNIVLAAVMTMASLFLGAAWFGLGKLEKRFDFGRDVPPRNLPQKRGMAYPAVRR